MNEEAQRAYIDAFLSGDSEIGKRGFNDSEYTWCAFRLRGTRHCVRFPCGRVMDSTFLYYTGPTPMIGDVVSTEPEGLLLFDRACPEPVFPSRPDLYLKLFGQ